MGKRASSIELSNEEREYLKLQTRARTIQAQTVTRARILLLRADSVSIDAIADKVGLNRCSVMLCLKSLKKAALKMHSLMPLVVAGMLRLQTKKKPGLLTLPARSQLILDMLLETWTYAKLTSHINKTAGSSWIYKTFHYS